MGETLQIIKLAVVLVLFQTSFGLVQENLLIIFPELIGTTGFILGIIGLFVVAILLVRHVISVAG